MRVSELEIKVLLATKLLNKAVAAALFPTETLELD